MYSPDFCDYTSQWFKKYMLDDSVKVNHEDLIRLYESLIIDIKEQNVTPERFSQDMDVRRILEKLISDTEAKKYSEDHMRFHMHVMHLDSELKYHVQILGNACSRSDWWNFSFI